MNCELTYTAYTSGGAEFGVSADVVRDGIFKSAPRTARDFRPLFTRNFQSDIVRVAYKKMGGHAEILVQVIDIELWSPQYGWFPVKYGVEITSGTPTATIQNRGHGHILKADHGGKETIILSDRFTLAD